jgi:hypothetical protein
VYWLDNVCAAVTRLAFMLLVLPWFQIIFTVAWCEEPDACKGSTYLRVSWACRETGPPRGQVA